MIIASYVRHTHLRMLVLAATLGFGAISAIAATAHAQPPSANNEGGAPCRDRFGELHPHGTTAASNDGSEWICNDGTWEQILVAITAGPAHRGSVRTITPFAGER